jgi:CRP-like cAMP-binding protein
MKTTMPIKITLSKVILLFIILTAEEYSTLSDGSSFGEKALLTKGKRTANVQAICDGHYAILEKSAFDKILTQLKSQERLLQGE